MGYTINDSDTRHNGWTNYATWRVSLEIFDGFDVADYAPMCVTTGDAHLLSEILAGYAEDIIDQDGTLQGLAVDYARAFLADVNWREIAEHLLDAARAEAV